MEPTRGKRRAFWALVMNTLGKKGFQPTHGRSRTRLYKVWSAMKHRCSSACTTEPARSNYYGRGIRVCEDWMEFEAFQLWALANGYRRGLTLERKDNSGNYEPSNCTFATWKEQHKNKRPATNHPRTKLSIAKVIEMRSLFKGGMDYLSLGERFHVHPIHAHSVAIGKFWKHVPMP